MYMCSREFLKKCLYLQKKSSVNGNFKEVLIAR